jgi:hypothetical protein
MNKMGKLIHGLLDTNGIGGAAFSEGVIKTMLPQTKPIIHRMIANETALSAFCGMVCLLTRFV